MSCVHARARWGEGWAHRGGGSGTKGRQVICVIVFVQKAVRAQVQRHDQESQFQHSNNKCVK